MWWSNETRHSIITVALYGHCLVALPFTKKKKEKKISSVEELETLHMRVQCCDGYITPSVSWRIQVFRKRKRSMNFFHEKDEKLDPFSILTNAGTASKLWRNFWETGWSAYMGFPLCVVLGLNGSELRWTSTTSELSCPSHLLVDQPEQNI